MLESRALPVDFDAVSPLDYRYRATPAGTEIAGYASETAHIRYQLRVEAAHARTLAQAGICDEGVADEIERACAEVTAEEVYREEARIGHNLRALVECVRRRVSPGARGYVHLFLTSSDVIDTAAALRLRDMTLRVVLRRLLELERVLIEEALATRSTPQVGRTHGQHAVPLTFGFFLAGHVSRLGGRAQAIEAAALALRGKASGAVGAYNAHVLASTSSALSPRELEASTLDRLGLSAGEHATQIVAPEPVADLAWAITSCFSVVADLADDVRHLMRSEIGELKPRADQAEVGSSTMPHKANPVRFEAVKSLWKAFAPRLTTVLMDQLSEHQRDLTNAASNRFLLELFSAFAIALDLTTDALRRTAVDEERMRRNLAESWASSVSETLYVSLALAGQADAYERVREAARTSDGDGLRERLERDEELRPLLRSLTPVQAAAIDDPEHYTGLATTRTEEICANWQERLFGAGGMLGRLPA